MTVIRQTVSISISASATTVCQSTVWHILPHQQWRHNTGLPVEGKRTNAGTNSNSYSYQPVNNDVVTCELTSNATCPTGNPATSNSINMTVNPSEPVSVSISASATTVCQVQCDYTATPTNGGTTPAYQWKVNAAMPDQTTAAIHIHLQMAYRNLPTHKQYSLSHSNPATSNSITMTVNPNLPVSISISQAQRTCVQIPM